MQLKRQLLDLMTMTVNERANNHLPLNKNEWGGKIVYIYDTCIVSSNEDVYCIVEADLLIESKLIHATVKVTNDDIVPIFKLDVEDSQFKKFYNTAKSLIHLLFEIRLPDLLPLLTNEKEEENKITLPVSGYNVYFPLIQNDVTDSDVWKNKEKAYPVFSTDFIDFIDRIEKTSTETHSTFEVITGRIDKRKLLNDLPTEDIQFLLKTLED